MLDAHLAALRSYEVERERVERLSETDIFVRSNPRENPYENIRAMVLRHVEDMLRDVDLIGYHCTRLHEDEIDSVRQDGLKPLSHELVSKRISRRVETGDLTESEGHRLLAKSRADDGCPLGSRSGMIWFVFTTGLLRAEPGVWRLFTFWGGEALYIAHEEDRMIAPLLRSLGTACIVEAIAPTKAVETFVPLSERLVRCYLHCRGIETAHDPEVEGYVAEAIPGPNIRRVIRRSDPEFVRLTACDTWSAPLS